MNLARGYSLIELVVVLVVAGILAAVVMPQFNQPQIDTSWYQEQAKAALRYAQRQAVAQRRTVYVFVSAGSVELCLVATNPCPAGSGLPDMATGNAYKIAAPSGVSLAPAAFSFDPLGQPSAGAPFTVGTVTVEAETGYVH